MIDLTNDQPDIEEIHLHAKDPYLYQLLINKPESVALTNCNDSTAFIEHSNDVDVTL